MNLFRLAPVFLGIPLALAAEKPQPIFDPKWVECHSDSECTVVISGPNCSCAPVNREFVGAFESWDAIAHGKRKGSARCENDPRELQLRCQIGAQCHAHHCRIKPGRKKTRFT